MNIQGEVKISKKTDKEELKTFMKVLTDNSYSVNFIPSKKKFRVVITRLDDEEEGIGDWDE